MEIIDELEVEKRGIYAGCVGYFTADGDMDTCIVLRTSIVKDGKMYVQSGAGIVADSVPENEHEECVAKARALFRAAEEAVRFAPASGGGSDGAPAVAQSCSGSFVAFGLTKGYGTAMTILVIDNYDSFTYNLVHFLGELGAKLAVRRNDKITRRRGRRAWTRRRSSSRPAPARRTRPASASR